MVLVRQNVGDKTVARVHRLDRMWTAGNAQHYRTSSTPVQTINRRHRVHAQCYGAR